MNPIGNLVGKFWKVNAPLTLAVFLVLAFLVSSGWSLGRGGFVEERGVLGNPSPLLVNSAEGAGAGELATLSESQGTASLNSDQTAESPSPLTFSDAISMDGTIEDPGQPIGQSLSGLGPISYRVQEGDSLSLVASYFNVSIQAIIAANPKLKGKSISAGETLVIPGSSASDSPAAESAAAAAASLPDFNSQFIMPAQGYNWGILEGDNGVDITNSCGTPVVAAASGIVVPDENSSDTPDAWNGGYGNFVLLQHPFGNNIETRYADLQSVSVQIGDYVAQGQQVGLMGQTGSATGCEVHFEVIGAQNPFAEN